MSKPFKVKRYHRIYGGRRSPLRRLLHALGVLVCVGALGFVGWSAYGPVKDYLDGLERTVRTEQTASSEAASQPEAPPEEPKALPLAGEAGGPPIHGVYLPASTLADAASLAAKLDALGGAVNTIFFDLKDDGGNVLYRSQVEYAAVTETAFDLAAVCKTLGERGLTAVGRVSAFRDPLAASRIPEAGVKYLDTKMLWNDDDPARGGKPWLNPYAQPAQAYIEGLAAEAVTMGVRMIVLDNVRFPPDYGIELARFGAASATQSRASALSAFIDGTEAKISALGGELLVYEAGAALLRSDDPIYGGQNPLALTNENLLVGMMPDQFGDGAAQEGFTVEQPILNPRRTVDTLVKTLLPGFTGKNITALLQGYTSQGAYTYNKPYTAQDMDEQVAALQANGIDNYIFYSADGNYPERGQEGT